MRTAECGPHSELIIELLEQMLVCIIVVMNIQELKFRFRDRDSREGIRYAWIPSQETVLNSFQAASSGLNLS